MKVGPGGGEHDEWKCTTDDVCYTSTRLHNCLTKFGSLLNIFFLFKVSFNNLLFFSFLFSFFFNLGPIWFVRVQHFHQFFGIIMTILNSFNTKKSVKTPAGDSCLDYKPMYSIVYLTKIHTISRREPQIGLW